MSRGLWFAAGAGAAVYTMLRARRAAEVLTPEGLEDRIAAWRHGARIFLDEVAQGRAEAETDLRERLGARPPGTSGRELAAAPTDDSTSSSTPSSTPSSTGPERPLADRREEGP